MSTKGLLLVIAVWFLMLWETSCTPVYTPVKVMVKVPIYCHPAVIPPFINYVSPVIPQTKAEEEELAAEIEVTMDELVEQNKELRFALQGCEKP
jgi:hypothetical protein